MTDFPKVAKKYSKGKKKRYFLVEERSLALDLVGVLEGEEISASVGAAAVRPRRDPRPEEGGVTSGSWVAPLPLEWPLEAVRICLDGEASYEDKQTFLATGSGDRRGGDRVNDLFRPNFLHTFLLNVTQSTSVCHTFQDTVKQHFKIRQIRSSIIKKIPQSTFSHYT